ncbi:DUF2268 domain-containing protein [Staphylococcus argenteus]|uniref:DUF2268 domain-containing protein n=1 Tax=Staphylococcus argenteus TaxID=985002 RepID=A0A7U7JRF5_9STAP|nr:DUF2268 domain-containing protein [Staphylococcus argenteus]BBN31311.1 hypothetical protein KUH140087_2184 [Staphylococcus aureus]ATY57839.1 metallopeptidase [Staphylococcus argenteus]ATZ88063.1 metallopeptidase [Staphylococcus argenteus]EKF1504608.1 DUF2268 domain-containing protein [Staphylococcus argenteus]EYG94007.1 hypothetical protein V676_00453 [Staphylococcus argenteus]
MYKINIIRSDYIYNQLLKIPLNERVSFFTNEILVPFRGKFDTQNIPIQNDKSQSFSAIQLLDAFQKSPEHINESDKSSIQYFDDLFWHNCEQYLKNAINHFEKYGIKSKISNYNFTVLLGDSKKPMMSLNENRCGDGGIPGYIMLYLVPSPSTLYSIKGIIAHETNHNMRYQYVKWDGGSLLELIISEGLAENYVEALYGQHYVGPWVTNIDWDSDNIKIKETIYNHLHLNHMFDAIPYLFGDEISTIQGRQPVGLPHAAGYACGYYLIKYFLEKTGIPIEKATIMPAKKIMNEVTEFWHTHTL